MNLKSQLQYLKDRLAPEHPRNPNDTSEPKSISLDELLLQLNFSGRYFILLILILPFLQPIPLLGLSTPLGLLMAFLIHKVSRAEDLFIPTRFSKIKLSQPLLRSSLTFLIKMHKGIEWLIKVRHTHLFQSKGLSFFAHSMMILHALLLSLPLPIPFTNAIPAWCIFWLTLSFLEEDGLLYSLALVTNLAGLIAFITLVAGPLLALWFLW